MDKKSKISLYILVFVVLMMMVAEVTKPKAVIWRDSYSAADKIPLGCYVIFNELHNELGDQLTLSSSNIFDYLKKLQLPNASTIIFINNAIYLGEEETNALLSYVGDGNTAFISTSRLEGLLADTLKVTIEYDYNNFYKQPSYQKFESESLDENEKLFEDVIENGHITSLDTLKTQILGTTSIKNGDESRINFIKTRFGNNGGAFYIHSNPFAFSNYHMLDGKEDYAATVLSFLPQNYYIWDNYYKTGRKIINSPLRFVLTNTALKWSFYTLLASLIMFVLFKSKRKQRIIPIVEPLHNSTVQFTRAIGGLYFQNGGYADIINKKIKYFLEYIRAKYYIDTNHLDERFINNLAQKSANSTEDTKKLVDLLVYLKTKSEFTKDELKVLNQMIETYKHNT